MGRDGRKQLYSGVVRDFYRFRTKYNFTQADLSRLFGVTQGYVALWENEKAFPPPRVVLKMVDILENFTTHAP